MKVTLPEATLASSDPNYGMWLKPKQAKKLAKLEGKAAAGKTLKGKAASKLAKLQGIAGQDAFGENSANGEQDPLKKRPSLEEAMLLRSWQMFKDDENLRGLQDEAMADAADTSDERQAAAGLATTNVHAALAGQRPVSTAGITDQAVARGRGLSRVLAQGDAAVEAQALKERLGYSRFGRERANLAVGAGLQSADIAQQNKLFKSELDSQKTASKYQNYATLAGVAAGGLQWWQEAKNQNSADLSDQLKTTGQQPAERRW